MKKLLSILVLSIFLASSMCVAAGENGAQKAVLITGASTGLGRAMTELLASQGHFVYAGARKDKDMAELNTIENVQAVRLDVTDQAQIDAAVTTITDAGRGLYGLVNNAGVVILTPLIETDEEDFDFQMDVNVYGPYRVTKAFAPLIIESKGRITTTGSIAGILSSAMFGPYSMTKHAMEAFTDSLADEMERFGVKVSVIEPGTYQSKIGQNMADRSRKQGGTADGSAFKADIESRLEWATKDLANSGDPIEVAQAAQMALFDENPKRRYLVVPNQGQAERTIGKALEELAQLNQDQKYSFSRDELVKMLDAALAANP
jgi:NAD(P)-dependent dehydrogenase (short-subunit alcohol dehydrogenase family)